MSKFGHKAVPNKAPEVQSRILGLNSNELKLDPSFLAVCSISC